MLLRHDGYWTIPSFKVKLTKQEKREIGRHSSPRWELDLVAYKGSTNEVLAVECKSFLDSTGVTFRNDKFEPEDRYKLFNDDVLRLVVFRRLTEQLVAMGATAASPKVTLCLAIGKIAEKSDGDGLKSHFSAKGWRLFDVEWLRERLRLASQGGYENDVAFVVSKILLRDKAAVTKESKVRLQDPKTTLER
jgi:hypothetical protein